MTALSSEDTYDVEAEGYAAFNAGHTPRHNPYSWANAQDRCKAWIRGHAAARTDRIAAQLGETPVEKVGPKGYIHGWIFVGIPTPGMAVHHPQHGDGVVTAVHGNTVHVHFQGQPHDHVIPVARPDEARHAPAPAPGQGSLFDLGDLPTGVQHPLPKPEAPKPAEPKAPEPKLEEPKPEPPAEEPKTAHGFSFQMVARKADALASRRERASDLSTPLLRDLVTEFERRATLMRKPGHVSDVHQSVLDELAKRDTPQHRPEHRGVAPGTFDGPRERPEPRTAPPARRPVTVPPAPPEPEEDPNPFKGKTRDILEGRVNLQNASQEDLEKADREFEEYHQAHGGSAPRLPAHQMVRNELARRQRAAALAPKEGPKEEPKRGAGQGIWAKVKGIALGTPREKIEAARMNAPAYSLADKIPDGPAKQAVQRLNAAKTVPEALKAVEDHWASLGDTFEYPPRLDRTPQTLENVKAIGTQLIALREAYPVKQLNLKIASKGIHRRAYAHVQHYALDPTGRQEMVLNTAHFKGASGVASFKNDMQLGFHDAIPNGTNPWTSIVTHEFGHVIDNKSGKVARGKFRTQTAEFLGQQGLPSPPQRTGGYAPPMSPEGYKAFSEQTSKYAREKPGEAIAEGFADVTLNGQNATALNWNTVRNLMAIAGQDGPAAWTIGGKPPA